MQQTLVDCLSKTSYSFVAQFLAKALKVEEFRQWTNRQGRFFLRPYHSVGAKSLSIK
jgi:predicted transcriptional regulator of viral defense system